MEPVIEYSVLFSGDFFMCHWGRNVVVAAADKHFAACCSATSKEFAVMAWRGLYHVIGFYDVSLGGRHFDLSIRV